MSEKSKVLSIRLNEQEQAKLDAILNHYQLAYQDVSSEFRPNLTYSSIIKSLINNANLE